VLIGIVILADALRIGFSAIRQLTQRFSVKPVLCPVGQSTCADLLIELYGGFVPVQYRPVQPAHFALDNQAGQERQQCLADAKATMLGQDKQVFQVNPRFSKES